MMRFWTQFRLVYELTSGMMSNKFKSAISGRHIGSRTGVERGRG